MEVTNCKGCGRLFNYLSGPKLCPECVKALEDKFQEVKDFLRNNPSAGIDQTSKETEVSVKQIKQWIREERLILSEACVDGITCEKCGAPIQSGRFCANCKGEMTNNLNSAFARPQQAKKTEKQDPNRNRMHFLQDL